MKTKKQIKNGIQFDKPIKEALEFDSIRLVSSISKLGFHCLNKNIKSSKLKKWTSEIKIINTGAMRNKLSILSFFILLLLLRNDREMLVMKSKAARNGADARRKTPILKDVTP